jgi:primosomal protein N' (replication factor Y)
MDYTFADIILPLAIKGSLTYSIPQELKDVVQPGVKVLVQLGNMKVYSGIVARVYEEKPDIENIRPIIKVCGSEPAVNSRQMKLWQWLADYYMCSEGEVMKAAVPPALFPRAIRPFRYEKYRPGRHFC